MLTSDARRAGYDWRAFSKAVRLALAGTEHGYRALADIVGVTISDLSRAAGGTNIGPEKVIAICDWIGCDFRDFYIAPDLPQKKDQAESSCFTASNVKHREAAQ